MTATVRFGHVRQMSDKQLMQKTREILHHIHLSSTATGGLHKQIVAEALLTECKDRGLLQDVQREFEERHNTTLKVGSVLPDATDYADSTQ